MTDEIRGVILSNKLYDRLKFVVRFVIPAMITLYSTIALTLEIPGTAKVTVIIGAIGLFLGSILGISSKNFTPTEEGVEVGDVEVTSDAEGLDNFSFQLTKPLEYAGLEEGKKIYLKVKDSRSNNGS